YSIGLHIDPARLSLVLQDLAGDSVHSLTVPTPAAPGPEHVLDLIVDQVDRLTEEAGVSRDRITAVGVATPGPLDVEHGSVVGPPLLPGWGTVRLRDELEQRLALTVVVEKDSTAAAIGEIWRAPRDSRNLAFLYLGSGISAGLVLGGEVLRGSGRAAGRLSHLGNIGHLTADPEGGPRPCRGRGCVAGSSLPAHIVDLAVARGALPPEVDTENAARGSARAAMHLANLLDLDSIAFGGPQGAAFEAACLRGAPSLVNEHYVAREDHEATVRGTAIGGNVGAVGAASLAMSETMFDARAQLSLR